MGCQEENKFLRFSDTPSIDSEGFVKVASSKEQLENMSLEDKERVVASVALLDTFTKDLRETVESVVEDLGEGSGLDDKIQEIVKKQILGSENPTSLDISQLYIIPNIGGAELRWNPPSYKKDYVVKVYQVIDGFNEIIATVEKGKNYHLLSSSNIDLEKHPQWFVRAFDGNEAGNPSNKVSLDATNWADVILSILHGKITETELARSLIDNLYSGFSDQLSEQLARQLERARTIVQQTEQQINSTISGLRDRLDQDILGVKQQLLDHGTGISTLERKSNEHAERIDTISAVAQGAVSGLQQEKVARATEQEAYARETNTKIAQVQGAIGTVRQELETKSNELESITNQVTDFRNIYNQNETRRTEEITNLANADKSLNEKLNQVDAKTVNSQAKLTALENVVAEKDRASTKRFNALRSSINGSHFPNYNFEDDINGWTTLQGEVSVVDTKDNSAPQKMALQALGNMPVTIHSNEPTRIEQGHSYSLTGVIKCPDGITKAELVMMCFDKDKNFITNIQTSPQYPLIDSKTNAGKGWVVLEGQISGNTTSWPTTDNTKIPIHAQYASPALIVTTKTGGKILVTKLDMQDNSESEKNKALIKALETTQNTDRESIATTLREQETRLKNGFSTATQQIQNKVNELDGKITAESSKIENLTSEVGGNKSKVDSLTQVVNSERSSNAAKFETLNTKFKRDLSNAIINPTFTKTEVTSTLDSQGQVQITGERTVSSLENWNCEPKNKFSVITFQDNQSQELKTKAPSNYYLKFWGNSLVPEGQLVVNPNDKIYVGLHAHNLNNTNAQIVVRYLNKDGEYLSQENLATFTDYTRVNSTLTVPDGADKAELVVFTNSNTLAERQAVIISKPELRMNMAAIYADGKFEEAKTLVSNAQETVLGKVESLTARYNQSEATNKLERQAISRANEAISGKVEEQGTRLGQAEGKIRTIEATQVTDKQAFTTFQRDTESKLNDSSSKISKLEKTTTTLENSIAETSKSLKSEFKNNLDTAKTELSGKIDQNERTASDKYRTLAERTTTIESKANTVDGRISNAIINERTNTEATASRVATEKSSELKVQFDARLSADQNNLLSFTDTMGWYVDKAKDETQTQSIEDNIATLRGDTTNWKHAYQFSKEGDKASDPKASKALTTVQPDLPYFLTFEARSNIEGNVLNPILRLYYKDVNNAKQWRNSNVPSVPLVDEWRTYQVSLTAPSLKANETRNYFGLMLEMKSTGTIQVRNPRLVYDAKTAIERINASIVETKQLAVDASGKVRAKIGLKVNAKGKAVGWSSEVNGDTNNFAINADNFKIANGADDYTPFSINATEKKIMFNGEVAFTRGSNLLKNPTLTSPIEYPAGADGNFPSSTSVTGWVMAQSNFLNFRRKGSDWIPNVTLYPNEIAISLQNQDTSAKAETRTGWFYQDLSVTPNKWYMLSGYIAAHRAKCRLLVEKISPDGSFISPYGGTQFSTKPGGRDLANYDRAFIKFKATSENIRVALEMKNLPNTSIDNAQFAWLFRPMLEECSENATGPSAFVPSSAGTIIDGDQIKTSLVRVGNGVNLLKNPGLWRDTPHKNSYDNSTWVEKAPYGWQDGYIGDSQNMCMSWHNSTRDASYKGGQGLPDRCDVIQLASGRTTAQMGWTIAMSQYLWLTPGRTYIYSIQGALYGSRSGCIVERYNPTGGYISTYGAIPLEQARSVENVNAMNWDRKWVKFTIPENHEGYVRVFIGLASAGDRSYSDGYFFRPMLEEVPIHQNEPSPWSDSATLITPNSISTNNLAALSSNMGRLRAGEIVLGNAHRLNSDGSVASWWNGGGTGTHLASDGVIRTNAIEIRGGWAYDPINVNGKFIVKPEGLVEIWGDDRANGIVLDAKNRYIAVMENGVPKVKLGRLW
jgi:hypothetical protein